MILPGKTGIAGFCSYSVIEIESFSCSLTTLVTDHSENQFPLVKEVFKNNLNSTDIRAISEKEKVQ